MRSQLRPFVRAKTGNSQGLDADEGQLDELRELEEDEKSSHGHDGEPVDVLLRANIRTNNFRSVLVLRRSTRSGTRGRRTWT